MRMDYGVISLKLNARLYECLLPVSGRCPEAGRVCFCFRVQVYVLLSVGWII